MFHELLVIAMWLSLAGLAHAGGESCQACHTPTQSERTCSRCHTESFQPRASGRSVAHLYATAPSFEDAKMRRVRPFDQKGLANYLLNPPRRRREPGGMFTMTPPQAQATAGDLAPWSEVSSFQARADQVEEGRRQFERLGCAVCHDVAGSAPKLPLGAQLYTFKYFKGILRGDELYYGTAASRQAMPTFAELEQRTLEALFSYISSAPQPEHTDLSDELIVDRNPELLSKSAEKILLRNGCTHCHGDRTASLAEASTIFGGSLSGFRLTRTPDGGLRIFGEALRSRPDGGNLLLDLLTERRNEWTRKDETNQRGMPLTLPPLEAAEMRTMQLWVKAGCPNRETKLCG